MKQETRISPRRANRHSVSEMVTNPARSAAYYGGALAAGIGICGMAYYLINVRGMVTGGAVLAVIGLFLVGMGSAGGMATRRNFTLFVQYVLDSFVEDVTETTETTQAQPAGTKAIPYTANGVTTQLELNENNPLSVPEWQAVAEAIILRNAIISEVSLARDQNVISQPKYRQMYSYMIQNAYIVTAGGKNQLTAAGDRYLRQWL